MPIARMLDASGTPIGGLYGAGVLCRNEFKYQIYAGSGTYIQFGLSMGRIAADHAAQYIENQRLLLSAQHWGGAVQTAPSCVWKGIGIYFIYIIGVEQLKKRMRKTEETEQKLIDAAYRLIKADGFDSDVN